MRVLIVEDSHTVAEATKDLLNAEGFLVETADKSETAVARLADPPPDLVVLDVLLPDCNGRSVFRRMRSTEAWRDVPVIVVSGMPPTEAFAGFRGEPHTAFLSKPFTGDELIGLIRRMSPPAMVRR